jgi:hypothetical protein
LFGDYAYRGPELAEYCQNDYSAQFYKRKKLNDILLDARYPPHTYYSQESLSPRIVLKKSDRLTNGGS